MNYSNLKRQQSSVTDTYFDVPIHHSVTSQPAIEQMIGGQIQADLTLKGLQDKRMWAILQYKQDIIHHHNIYSRVQGLS